jgi:hypothetical protein
MPVNVDLAQFPRLVCPRCGLVALVDPALPLDLHPSLTCPNCARTLGRPRRATAGSETLAPRPERRRAPSAAPAKVSGPVPSHAAVGLAIAAIFMLLLIGLFIWLALTPHQSYWWALTR